MSFWMKALMPPAKSRGHDILDDLCVEVSVNGTRPATLGGGSIRPCSRA